MIFHFWIYNQISDHKFYLDQIFVFFEPLINIAVE